VFCGNIQKKSTQTQSFMKINWDNIETVFLDMDGTLLDLHFDNHFWLEYVPQKYADKFSMNLADAKEKLYATFKTMEGKLEWYCIDYWSEQLDLNILELKRDCSHMISIRPSVDPLLIALKEKGIKVVMATNAHQNTLHLKLEVSLLHHHFDHLYSAHDFGYPKEDINFWKSMQNRCSFDPKRSVFIDDNLTILEVAKTYGIKYCLGIELPDSKGTKKQSQNFPIITNFSDLF